MMWNTYNENEMLRMTKDELIDHIFDLYKNNRVQWESLVFYYEIFEKIDEMVKKGKIIEEKK